MYMAGIVIATMAICSCDEDTASIGTSLTNESDIIVSQASEYEVTTRTIVADSVLSLSNTCYFGRVKDPETGSDVTSEFTTQFHLLESTYIGPEDKVIGRDEQGRACVDSCDIILYLQSPFKTENNLTAMKMRMYELAQPMDETQRYYSNFNPKAQGLLREEGLVRDKMFTYQNNADTDSLRETSTYFENICISLNQPYTDVKGVTYKNYGTYLMHQYYDHPEYYKNSYVFAHQVCPGFFFEVTDGSGFHSMIYNIGLRVYYTLDTDTATVRRQLILAGTKEVTQTTHVFNDREAIKTLAQEDGYTYLKSPAGLFTEVTLPVKEVKANHRNDSLLAAKIIFQRLNNKSTDYRLFELPQNLLMVQKDSLYSYFENNDIPDNTTSYVCTFAAANPNSYTFSNISNLITYLWNQYNEGVAEDAQWEAKHPNWNKVVLVPVSVTTTSSTVTKVENSMALTSTRLVGGPLSPIKMSVVYANFK